jgi:carbon storage regulator CsrA
LTVEQDFSLLKGTPSGDMTSTQVVMRRAGEAIIVAGDIEVEIIEISRTRVKLGITAPREVTVTRKPGKERQTLP